MKKYNRFLAVFVAVAVIIGIIPIISVNTQAEVSFNNRGITNERLAEMVADGTIPHDVWVLNLSNNLISDLTPLSELTQLRGVNLSHNRIRDITPLADIPWLGGHSSHFLFNVDLSHNFISDITSLSVIREIGTLNLRNNQIRDLTPLLGIRTMLRLDITDNLITVGQVNALIADWSDSNRWQNRIDLTHNAILPTCTTEATTSETSWTTPPATCEFCPPLQTSTTPPISEPDLPTIYDVLEILKQLAGLPSNAPSDSTIHDALEILKVLAGI
jgi:hypothetical protein